MKKNKKGRNFAKKLMSGILAMTMAAELVPGMAMAASAAVNENLVNSLAEVYDGDSQRAREELEALYQAGIIDENGNMVELSICEDGVSVALDEITAKITSGEEVGSLTVNGHAATQEQLVKISATKQALEIAKMLAEDVEITDEHVANLESLIEGIGDGSIDVDAALESGTLSLDSKRKPTLNAARGSTVLAGAATGEGTVDADADGKYTASYISGSDYEASHSFQLADPTNKTYYTDSNTEGIVSDGVVSFVEFEYGSVSTSADSYYTLKLTVLLDKPQTVPVSFDYAVASSEYHNIPLASGKGTVTWEPGESGEKTIEVKIGAFLYSWDNFKLWHGERGFVINAGNIKNAVFSGDAQAVSKNVLLTRADHDTIKESYAERVFGTITPDENGARVKEDYSVNPINSKKWCYVWEEVDWLPFEKSINYKVRFNSSIYDSIYNSYLIEHLSSFSHELIVFTETSDTETSDTETFDTETFDIESTFDGNGFSNLLRHPDKLVSHKIFTIQPGSQTQTRDFSWTSYEPNGSDYDAIAFELPKMQSENGKAIVGGFISATFNDSNSAVMGNRAYRIESIEISAKAPAEDNKINDVSVPAGTYYSGQVIPITVTLEDYAVGTEDTKLTVNNIECPLLDSVGIESKMFTFGYTVREEEAITLNVTGVKGFKVSPKQDVKFPDGFPSKSFGKEQDVNIISDIKRGSLDLTSVKYGISDDAAGQVVTVLIPFKDGAKKDWIANENEDCTTDGMPVSLPVPGYENATTGNYLRGAYFSYDKGKTRYPVYIVDNAGEEGVALAARFAVPVNASESLRLDTLNLYMDVNTIGISDASTYLDTWENAKFDAKGYAYFDGTDKAESGLVAGAAYSYYVKSTIPFDETAYTSRGEADYASKTENGFLNLDDRNHVFLQDAEHPENQYDVEIIANDALYNALQNGVRAEDTADLTLSYQISGRKGFSFVNPQDFTWKSSDETIATVKTDKNGMGHVTLTGNSGEVSFSLTVGNGSEENAYTLTLDALTVLEGKTPFLNISEYSRIRQTLTYTDTDVAFASNVTARNAEADKTAVTTFTVALYKATPVTGTDDQYNRTGEPIWTSELESTVDEVLTHITVPGEQILDAGAYEVVITTQYNGIQVSGKRIDAEELSAKAYIVAKESPAWIKLNKLDSYYVTAGDIPTIGYTNSDKVTEVEYTVQKTGEAVSERKKASGGVIPFAPDAPNSLKEAYTITVYARNKSTDEWSIDSMLLTVYNPQILHQIVADVTAGEIGGTTGGKGTHADGTVIEMDNTDKVSSYLDSSGYKLTYQDFTALRTDMSLQKIVSVNYGEAVYGLLSDKMMWNSSDPDKVSVNYEQGGIYSDIRNYSYTSYTPATDFLLVGKNATGDGEKVTITATHANTGISSSFDVTTKTLKNQLYVLQFYPAVTTTVIYTNGKGEKRRLETNEKGELAVYEPDGITGKVMTMSRQDNTTYAKTFDADTLETGERDISALQLYPCNNVRMEEVSGVNLTIQNPDGSPYSGPITLRGGVYKNGTYCPDALISVKDEGMLKNGRQDIAATVTDGKLQLQFDPESFTLDQNDQGAQPGDKVTYVIEYRTGNSYLPGYVMLNAGDGSSKRTDSMIRFKSNPTGKNTPQIISQTLQRYFDNEPIENRINVTNYTENIGINKRFNKAELYTDVVLLGEPVTTDENGYSVYGGKSVTSFALYTANNKQLTGQTTNSKSAADQILNLSDLDSSSLFVFPFSSLPTARSSYTLTDENLKKDGITGEGTNANPTTRIKAMLVRDGVTVYSETMPYGLANYTNASDLSASGGGAKEIGEEINQELKSKLDMGSIFKDIDVNDMLKKGFVFLSKFQTEGGDNPMSMMILPTSDPGKFRIIVLVGENQREEDEDDDGISIEYDPNQIADDAENFEKELKEIQEKMEDSGKKKKKDKDDDDDGGETSFEANFYGTIILEAKVGGLNKNWDINFCGGNVGTNLAFKYEWGQNFMCGPVPVTISFEIKATADLEVAFANKAEARALLIDAAVGISIEAFAGLGFDMSLFALKLGIFGNISAKDNFLYLTTNNQTGNKLEIAGEIGIRLEVKVVLVKYKKTFASTGFNWSKTWGKYDQIQETWEKEGYADLSGTTKKGKPYTMRLMSNGTAMVTIDSGGEIENRDYLKNAVTRWKPVAMSAASDSMAELYSNAYPYSNPVLTDDGSMLLYLSDNNNSKAPESVVCYAVKNENGYTDMGRVDLSADILADSDVVASGTGSNAFAAWVKQMDSPEKEMHDEATYDDLGMMLNATEIYGSVYRDGQWTVERLTDNTMADMSPTIASSGNRAVVAWRSLSATAMPEEGAEQDLSTMFNTENSLRYRIYDGENWKEAQIAYNGTAGTVNAVDSAMLPDGTSMLVYTVRTGEDITSAETFYTVIDPNGDVLTTGRLTNDDYTDTNAQVTTVGDQFIVGWYSEHVSDVESDSDETVVSHDIGLARINANGSVDAAFPESIGGTSASSISSDFHFSSPVNNKDLSKLSIVWSQAKTSDKEEDAGKHQLNAVRFYEKDSTIGVTAQTVIAETNKNYTIDHFDTYTDENDEIKAVLIGSDYNSIDGMDVFDTIDMTDLPIDAVNDAGEVSDHLAILEQEPTASIKLASGIFPKKAVEVNADTDLYGLLPGLDLPVQFTVRNTGTDTVNTVDVQIDGQNTQFTELNLLPGQSAVLTASYSVPETVRDVKYTFTADDSTPETGTLLLNRPDAGISSMTVTRESNKERDIQLILSNASNIPLMGSGKTVRLAFYKDSSHQEQIGDVITLDPSVYQDIDDDIYTYTQTLNVEDFIGDAQEVPEEGVRIYASTWVEDTEELYTTNNDANVAFKGLLSKYQSQITMNTALIAGDDGNYTVTADISNNSLQNAELGSMTADILDSENNVLASVPLSDSEITLQGEQTSKFSVATPKLKQKPTSVSLRSSEKTVSLDAQTNGGSSDAVTLSLTKDNTPADTLPEAVRSGYLFEGWFTEPVGGEKITNETVLQGGMTLYAQFVVDPDQAAADAVTALIDALPAEISLADRETVETAFEEYDKLTDAQKAKIDEAALTQLTNAVTALNTTAAKDADDKIAAIGEVSYTAESKALINAARIAYDALTDEQKKLTVQAMVLKYAENLYDVLEEKMAAEEALTNGEKNAAEKVAAAEAALKDAEEAKAAAEKAAEEAAEKAAAAEKALAAAEKEAAEKVAAAEAALKDAEEAKAAAETAAEEAAEKAVAAEKAKEAAEAALANGEKDAAEKVATAEAAQKAAEEAQSAAENSAREADEKADAAEAAQKSAQEAQSAAEKNMKDMTAARNVDSKIVAIGIIEYTDACNTAITEARTAYKNLTDVQQELVVNLTLLKNAEAEYAALKAKADEIVLGDANDDGDTTLVDVVLIRRYLAGGWNAEINLTNADMDGNGEITIKDAILLLRHIVDDKNASLQ